MQYYTKNFRTERNAFDSKRNRSSFPILRPYYLEEPGAQVSCVKTTSSFVHISKYIVTVIPKNS